MKIIRRRVSVVVVHQGQVLGFHAEDPHNHRRYFFLPGGVIEEGETPSEAACRETLEETGYQIELVGGLSLERQYDFEWNGQINHCLTQYLAGRLVTPEAAEVQDAPYHRGAGWVPIQDIPKVFAYHQEVLEPTQWLAERLAAFCPSPGRWSEKNS